MILQQICLDQVSKKILFLKEYFRFHLYHISLFILQTLSCTDTPRFDAEGVVLNKTGTHLAVWGQTGITAIELPQRQGNFEGRRPCVTCKYVSLFHLD